LNFLDRFSKNNKLSKFHENLSSVIQDVPCGQTEMTELRATFWNLENTLKNQSMHRNMTQQHN